MQRHGESSVPGPDPTDLAKGQIEPRPWYLTITGGQWLALVAALLGWMFDGFEQGVFPLVSRPALIEVLGLRTLDHQAKDKDLPAQDREDAKNAVDGPVRSWYALITAAYLLGAAAGGLVFGWLGDRIGRVRAMVFSVLTYALFTGASGLAQSAWQLIGLRFVASLGMGGEWALGVALVMESWPGAARPLLAGLIGASANVGYLLVGAIGTVLKPAESWRWIFGICVLPALLTFLLRTFVPESERWHHATATGPKPRIGDIFTPKLRSRSLLGACLGAIALLATWGSVQWIPPWLGQIDPKLVPVGQMCLAVGAIVGALLGAVLGGRLSRRLGYFTLCLLSLLVCEALFLGFREGPRGPYDVPFFALATVAGGFSAAFYGWLPLYLPELFPTRVRATGQGFSYNSGRILAAFGVLLTTFSIDLKGNYPAAAAIVVLIYLAGIGIAWVIPETKGQPLPE